MFHAPDSFKDRYCPLVDDPERFLEILDRQLPKSFRVNTLKASPSCMIGRFREYGITITQVPWYESAFVSEKPEVGATIEHFLGHIYLQELVSMLPPLIVREELEQAQFVLDGCAAPGSKTTQMAALMDNRGTIIANDLDYSRIRALKFNLEKTGTLNAVMTNYDLQHFPKAQFDVVLLDVPCSAEGTLRKNWEVFTTWSPKEVKKYSKIQKNLILTAFDLLRPGGVMTYSTCTFAPEENEEVVNWLLENRPAELEKIAIDGIKLSPAVPEWEGKRFDDAVSRCARVWPHHNDTGGFFLAKVRK